MDGTAPAATPNDLYKRIGTTSAPLLIDVRQQNAFKANDRLIIGASNSPPPDFDVAWNTCRAGRTFGGFIWAEPSSPPFRC
jgi:hypothetical protein